MQSGCNQQYIVVRGCIRSCVCLQGKTDDSTHTLAYELIPARPN